MADQHLSKVWIPWVEEFFFSLNLAWILIWLNREREHPFLFPATENSPLLERFYRHIRLVEPSTVLEQVLWSLVLSLLFFGLLRLLAYLSVTRVFMHTVAGVFALTSFLFFYLIVRPGVPGDIHLRAHILLLSFEMALAVAGAMVFYLQRFKIPDALYLLWLVLHFGFWAWVSSSYVNVFREITYYGLLSFGIWISVMFYFGFPVIGFLASLAWGLEVRANRKPRLTS